MSYTPVRIVGADGTPVVVTGNGSLVVGSISPNTSKHWAMTATNAAYIYATPIPGKKMILQNVLMYGNKGIGAGDAAVIIYTSANPAGVSPTNGDIVLEMELPKYSARDILGLNVELPEGVYLLAKTDDATVFLTMMGYYVNI